MSPISHSVKINSVVQHLIHCCTAKSKISSTATTTRDQRHLAKAALNDPVHTASGVHCTRCRQLPRTVKSSWGHLVHSWQTDRQTQRNISNNNLHLMHSMQPENQVSATRVLRYLSNIQHYQQTISLCLPVLDKFTAVTGTEATAVDRGCARTIFWGFGAAADRLIAWLWPV